MTLSELVNNDLVMKAYGVERHTLLSLIAEVRVLDVLSAELDPSTYPHAVNAYLQGLAGLKPLDPDHAEAFRLGVEDSATTLQDLAR